MKKLAFEGHETRGREVIKVLEMLGGKERIPGILEGNAEISWYYINENGYIDFKENVLFDYDNTVVFTLEEFLEKYPYKVGDNVYNIIHNETQVITKLSWDAQETKVVYQTDNNEYVYVNYLRPYKEETVEERKYAELRMSLDDDDKLSTEVTIDGNKIIPPENYLIGKVTQVDNGMLVEFVKKQTNYPKTYKECCDILGYNASYDLNNITTHDCVYDKKLQMLYKLLICRDAYWKIAGEQMGLNEPWKPEWNWREYKFCIVTLYDKIEKFNAGSQNTMLAFPTEEMRDTFYENFKELIEECKELL